MTPCITARQASLSITNSQSLLKLMPIESVMPSSHLILCCPLLLLPPIPRSIRVFSNESDLRIKWPKYWSFSFSISLSNENPGLTSFRMDWLDLLAVFYLGSPRVRHDWVTDSTSTHHIHIREKERFKKTASFSQKCQLLHTEQLRTTAWRRCNFILCSDICCPLVYTGASMDMFKNITF